ncbi:beta-galactosidase [Treponema phagedenis]|nr:beta-galactosidase [Treponema phagedenis]
MFFSVYTLTMIQFDSNSWIIDGKRKFIISAAVHYFRLPRAEWAAVIRKARLGGCNAIETYIAWNYHETAEEQWDFSGDKDLAAFFAICHDEGMYVIVRPGPYICAEWDFGGLPYYLNNTDGIEYRCSNAAYEQAVRRYFERIMPIIRRYQLGSGGSIIMVQIENEYHAFGKKDLAHIRFLEELTRGFGITVPLVSCYGAGRNTVEMRNFWSGAERAAAVLRERQSGQPLGIMEFWIGWFEHWGGEPQKHKPAEAVLSHCFEALKSGFVFFNYYMYFGGSNFGSWGGRTIGAHKIFMTQSYDYDAPLDEFGFETEKYRLLAVLHTFIAWLENDLTAGSLLIQEQAEHELSVTKAEYPSCRVYYYAHTGKERRQVSLTLDNEEYDFSIQPEFCTPVITEKKITEWLRLCLCTEITSGFYADSAEIFMRKNTQGILVFELSEEAKAETQNGTPLFVEQKKTPEGRYRLSVQCVYEKEDALVLRCKRFSYTIRLRSLEKPRSTRYFDDLRHTEIQTKNWQCRPEVFDFTRAKTFDNPQSFSAMDRFSGYLAYQTEIIRKESGKTLLFLTSLEDPALLFVNGSFYSAIKELGCVCVEIELRQGKNKLVFVVQNMGRYNYTAGIGEPKGLSGAVYADAKTLPLLDGWKIDNAGASFSLDAMPKIDGDIPFVFEFENPRYDVAFLCGEGASSCALNGKASKVLFEERTAWNRLFHVFSIADASAALTSGTNELYLDVLQKGTIQKLSLFLAAESDRLRNWNVRPIAEVQDFLSAKNLPMYTDTGKIFPSFYKTRVRLSPAKTPVLAAYLKLGSLQKGNIYFNGFDIGRFWNIGPQIKYKIPVSLLQETNELVIFDEYGANPNGVSLCIVTDNC